LKKVYNEKIITLSAILALQNGFSQNQVLTNFVYLNNSSNLGNQSNLYNNNSNSTTRNQAVLLASNQMIQRSNTNKVNNASGSQATQQSNKNTRKINHQNRISNPVSQSNAINTNNINTIQVNDNVTNSDNQNMHVLIFENNLSDQAKLPANPIKETIETSTPQKVSFSLDLSLPKSIGLSAASSSRVKSNHLGHKWEKFKRQLLGKLTSHKKSKYHVDICFLWSK
jgi:hypothetical protein